MMRKIIDGTATGSLPCPVRCRQVTNDVTLGLN